MYQRWLSGLIIVMVAIGMKYIQHAMTITRTHVNPEDSAVLPALAPELEPATSLVDNQLISKYKSDIVKIEAQRLLYPGQCEHAPRVVGSLLPVASAMEAEKQNDKVFLMLNGENEGYYFTWPNQPECLHALAYSGALALGADKEWAQLGVRLYTQNGHIVQDIADLQESNHILHVLLESQLWAWPGIQVGHVTRVDDKITLKTLSLAPKVFAITGLFTEEESMAIKQQGELLLGRSEVNRNGAQGVSDIRTSHTAFLPPSQLTRKFQVRGSKLARLPSPSFSESIHLVRYNAGEYYKRHLDTFGDKDILPKAWNRIGVPEYLAWVNWAEKKVDELGDAAPDGFRRGQLYFPNASDDQNFPNALLNLFWDFANETQYFKCRFDQAWEDWLRYNLDVNAKGTMKDILEAKGDYLRDIVRVWEAKLGLPSVHYTFRRQVHAISQWHHWIRTRKELISHLDRAAPEKIQPYGPLYPKFDLGFENTALELLQKHFADRLTEIMPQESVHWMKQNKGRRGVLFNLLRDHEAILPHLIQAWEIEVSFTPVVNYKMPQFAPHLEPQRYATIFLYLNTVDEGGETVFPYSNEKWIENISRPGMAECSEGLAVPAVELTASLFYVQTPTQQADLRSRHGGCPPVSGTKWGANLFLWNVDAEEGESMWLQD